MRISDWSSDVCSSDLGDALVERGGADIAAEGTVDIGERHGAAGTVFDHLIGGEPQHPARQPRHRAVVANGGIDELGGLEMHFPPPQRRPGSRYDRPDRSEGPQYELPALMRHSYTVF